jgi:hypothetical protein
LHLRFRSAHFTRQQSRPVIDSCAIVQVSHAACSVPVVIRLALTRRWNAGRTVPVLAGRAGGIRRSGDASSVRSRCFTRRTLAGLAFANGRAQFALYGHWWRGFLARALFANRPPQVGFNWLGSGLAERMAEKGEKGSLLGLHSFRGRFLAFFRLQRVADWFTDRPGVVSACRLRRGACRRTARTRSRANSGTMRVGARAMTARRIAASRCMAAGRVAA